MKNTEEQKAKGDQRDRNCAGEAELLKAPVTYAAGKCNMPDKFKLKVSYWHDMQYKYCPRNGDRSLRCLSALKEHSSGYRESKI